VIKTIFIDNSATVLTIYIARMQLMAIKTIADYSAMDTLIFLLLSRYPFVAAQAFFIRSTAKGEMASGTFGDALLMLTIYLPGREYLLPFR